MDSVKNLQCRIADWLGLDFCLCCARWHRKSGMGLEGLCRHCDAFVAIDRIFRVGA